MVQYLILLVRSMITARLQNGNDMYATTHAICYAGADASCTDLFSILCAAGILPRKISM